MPHLDPAPRQIGIFDQLIAHESETLILREKVLSLSGDSFEIKLQSGRPILKVQGKAFSMSGRKTVHDMQDNHLFDIRKEHFHWHSTYSIESPNGGEKIMEVKSKFKLFGSKATATFKSANGQDEELKMEGKWTDYSAKIKDSASDALIAKVDRKILSGRDLLFGQQTYALTVAPNVDMALMAALCICLDEENNDQRGR